MHIATDPYTNIYHPCAETQLAVLVGIIRVQSLKKNTDFSFFLHERVIPTKLCHFLEVIYKLHFFLSQGPEMLSINSAAYKKGKIKEAQGTGDCVKKQTAVSDHRFRKQQYQYRAGSIHQVRLAWKPKAVGLSGFSVMDGLWNQTQQAWVRLSCGLTSSVMFRSITLSYTQGSDGLKSPFIMELEGQCLSLNLSNMSAASQRGVSVYLYNAQCWFVGWSSF